MIGETKAGFAWQISKSLPREWVISCYDAQMVFLAQKRTPDTALWQSEPPEHVSAGLPAWPPSGLCIVSFVSFGSSFGSSFNGLTIHLTASCDQF